MALRESSKWTGRALIHWMGGFWFLWTVGSIAAERLMEGSMPRLGAAQTVLFFAALYAYILTLFAPAQARRYRLVEACVRAIEACAAAHGRGNLQHAGLNMVSTRVSAVEQAIFRAPRALGLVGPTRRSRRDVLRQHANAVVLALRASEEGLDGRRKDACLGELAGLLLQIASSAAAGRIGELLPESATVAYEGMRVSDWAPLRTVCVAAAVIATALGVTLLGLEAPIAELVITCVFAVASLLAFGRNWQRMTHLLDLFRPT
ncbi:hypothetical protein [Streptomyces sp. SPB074]|uniref:hypothetical protein n=1 Tax=Streptomyces sp. (strain SPB074) TaxID=465543 RepID=UPI00017FEA10|nr:hypothetical protein [Streptomyces sp. SPB074]